MSITGILKYIKYCSSSVILIKYTDTVSVKFGYKGTRYGHEQWCTQIVCVESRV